VTTAWLLLSLLAPPAVAAAAALAFRQRTAGAVTAIALNAAAPGAGLAALQRPVLEVVLGVLFAQASLLVTGGIAQAAFLLPIAAIGGLWASLHTPLSPLDLATRDRRRSPDSSLSSEPPDPVASMLAEPASTVGAPSEAAGEEAGFSVVVPCTECGAAVEVPVLAHMARCPFCGSHHLVIGHEETLFLTLPEKLTDDAALRATVLDHYRYRHYLELYRRAVAPLEAGAIEATESGLLVSRPEAEAAVAAAEEAASRRADAYRASLSSRLEVRRQQRFLAPYRHGVGTLFEAAFGRSKPGLDKRLRFAVGTVEASTLATRSAELPAMGRLSYLRTLRPAATCDPAVQALPLDVGEDGLRRAFGELERKQLVRDLAVIRLGVAFAREVSAVIWRSWWIAEVEGPGIDETLLVDGAAAAVVGPAPAVDPAALEELPPAARNPGAGLRFTPMECPTCGHEFPFDVDAVLHFCTNCHRVCRVDGDRKGHVDYSFGEPARGRVCELVPCWVFPLRLRTADGRLLTDLAHLTDGIDGRLDQIGEDAAVKQHLVATPAFRCINSRLMGVAFEQVFAYLADHPPRLVHERFPLTERPRPWSVNLDEASARRLLPLYLANAFSPRDLARAKVDQVSSWIFEAIQEMPGRLAYLPIPRPVTEPFRHYVGRYQAQALKKAKAPSPPGTRG
jgi:Zn finger protein HypA/HybF involved in hydrogenase expression